MDMGNINQQKTKIIMDNKVKFKEGGVIINLHNINNNNNKAKINYKVK